MIANIENWLEGIYPIKVSELRKMSAGLVISAEKNNRTKHYILKASELSAERLLFIQIGLSHLLEKGFSHVEKYTETLQGLPYAQTEAGIFTLTPYHSEPGLSFDNREELSIAIRLLAQMHLAGRGFTQEEAHRKLSVYGLPYTVKCPLGDTTETFYRRLGELRRFRKLASKGNSPFDYSYSKMAGEYCALGEALLEALESSSYKKLVEESREKGCLCHRDFTGHNTVKCSPLPLVINFENMAIELPAYDLANLIRRRLRKCNWDPKDAFFILEEYSKLRPITEEELELIKILLQFPQKLWRVVNKYYNSKRGRYEKTGLAKLAEIQEEKEPLASFIKLL